ncbi:uncharacterized protein LOC143445254 isoform X2 [Clavelina lepadiformis]|uniref:uncharacterized protein LOC143445254 isoform X2 n=1 Tax=Clavelina lepadiformis TaxID=159417 RepID=UPI00404347E2
MTNLSPQANPILVQAPGQVVMPAIQPPVTTTTRKKYKRILMALGIAETVLGACCTLLGVILVVYAEVPTKMPSVETYYDYYYNANKYRVVYRFYKFFTTGEGIWSGSLILFAGGLGIAAGSSRSTSCLINTHMGFAIMGTISSTALIGVSIFLCLGLLPHPFPHNKAFYLFLAAMLCVMGFVSLVLLITSSVYASYATSAGCCGASCCEQQPVQPHTQQVMYVTGTSSMQIPGMVQGSLVIPQGQNQLVQTGATQLAYRPVEAAPQITPNPSTSAAPSHDRSNANNIAQQQEDALKLEGGLTNPALDKPPTYTE